MKSLLFVFVLCGLAVTLPLRLSAQLTLENIAISREYKKGHSETPDHPMRQSMLLLSPALRVANVPSMTEDWMTLDIGEIVVAPYRPRISMRKPLVMGQQSAIVIEPGEDTPYLRITNFGSSGTDGIKMFYGNDYPASFVFNLTYDVIQGKESIEYGDDLSEIVLTRTYDKSTPKLLEKISSGNMGVNSFFDITYDLQALTEIRRVTDLSEDVTKITSYDKSTPKLSEKISSGNMGVNSFFDIEYDIQALVEKKFVGDLSQHILISNTYDKSTPKLEEKISSGNMGVDNFFLTSYDLPTLTATSKGGNLTESVTFTVTYDKATPKLLEKISSGNAGATSFFDITWDLSQASRPRHELAFIGEGLVPMRKQTDCEILTRIINERYAEEGGLSHTVEHRMTPDPITGTSMWALLGGGMESSFLRVNGGGAPFSVVNTGNVLSNGNMDITGVVHINGELQVTGVKNFKIDHPLDPENKYLTHSCVESPDMMNIYNGNVTTDAKGNAQVTLPDYFGALNCDFRYQLTCMGQFAQAIIAEKIKDNHFTIQTDKPNVEVSWQVTGVRHDAAALKYKRPVEGLKKS